MRVYDKPIPCWPLVSFVVLGAASFLTTLMDTYFPITFFIFSALCFLVSLKILLGSRENERN